jgi:hypothetical protein
MTVWKAAWKEKSYSTLISNNFTNPQHVKISRSQHLISNIFAFMRQILLFSLLVLLIVPFSVQAQRQSVGCMDKGIRLQADEIKQHYVNQGCGVYRDAMLNMSSMTPSPVVVQLEKGEMYQIIFVGTLEVYRMNLEMFDANENKLIERFVFKNRQQPNYIIVNFIPERSDDYLFTLMQKLKNRDMCGSFCILKMKSDKKNALVTPYQ